MRRRKIDWQRLAIIFSISAIVALALLLALPAVKKLSDSNLPASLPIANPAPLPSKPEGRKSTAPVEEAYGRIPLSFERNQGQTDNRVKFLSRGSAYSLVLTGSAAVLEWLPADKAVAARERTKPQGPRPLRSSVRAARPASTPRRSASLGLALVNANRQVRLDGLEELPGKNHYLLGANPEQWRLGVPSFAKVACRNVYPGIDWVFYGNPRQLEYDFVVFPGADPRAIQIEFQGAEQMEFNLQGELVLQAGGAEIKMRRPRIYQESGGNHTEIAGGYVRRGANRAGFEVAAYDPTRPLIIDPVLVYSSYLGGNDEDSGNAIAVDAAGNVYLAGSTRSTGFPPASPLLSINRGGSDVFIIKLNAAGAVVYSTFLGGSGNDAAYGIALDGSGNVYLAGSTESANFPTLNPVQPGHQGGSDAFVAKLNAAGSALVYSTFLGGAGDDVAAGIAINSLGYAYITGFTDSANFPLAGAFQPAFGGKRDVRDAFVTKLNVAGNGLIYSSYVGGSRDELGTGIAVDAAGNAYLCGGTSSDNFPTVNPLQPAYGGNLFFDAYVAKVNPLGSALLYSTYLGGSGVEVASAIAVDASGAVYVSGVTNSNNFPLVNASQEIPGGQEDAFAAKLTPAGTALTYSTFLGGSEAESATGIAVDAAGNAYLSGFTFSTNFPTANPLQSSFAGGQSDAFVAKLNPGGDTFLYSTYLGGSQSEGRSNFILGNHIAVDAAGDAFVTGSTTSPDFPTVQPLQAAGVLGDAFVSRISFSTPTPDSVTLFVPIVLSAAGLNNSFFTSELALTNRGSSNATLDFAYTAAFGGGSGTASDTLPAGQQRIIPDAIRYLRSLGVPLPDSGNRGGTLFVKFSGLSSVTAAAVTARTTAAVAGGRAGLAYAGLPPSSLLTGTAYLCGLRQNAADRSNVAIQNAGTSGAGDIVLRLTVFSGGPQPFSQTLPNETLSPGGFKQISGILTSNGLALAQGYVRIERIIGTAPYYAYAIINDQANSDGSFVPPIPENALAGTAQAILPVMVETSAFNSEVVFANWSATPRTINFEYVADPIQNPNASAGFRITLDPGTQSIFPDFVQVLRTLAPALIGPRGAVYAGGLFASAVSEVAYETVRDLSGIFIGARTSAAGGGGRYGLFYTAVPSGNAPVTRAWIYGLQQNAENRTNLALLNTGAGAQGEGNILPDVFTIEIYDGATGAKANTVEGIRVNARRWLQLSSLLSQYAPRVAQGYAQIIRTSGINPFIAYAVINDGGQPGERTGDGAYVVSSP